MIFGFVDDKRASCCSKCKKDGMIDIKHPKCPSSWCDTILKKKYNGYCLFCYMNLFPDKPVSRNYKTKQFAVENYITAEFPEVTWIKDKQVSGGCSRRRPDVLVDMGDYVIIVEIDENQHVDTSCENKRTCQLFEDNGRRPIYFIRFNPDGYTNSDGVQVRSCWGYDKTGKSAIKKAYTINWEYRLETLGDEVRRCLSGRPKKEIDIIYLFYDNFSSTFVGTFIRN